MEALFKVFENTPRQGPGSDELTRRALTAACPLPENPVVLDLGCGTGTSTLVLARELGTSVLAPITAVDIHQPFLDELMAQAARDGLEGAITTRRADFADLGAELGIQPESMDLIWAEGSVFILGFAAWLEAWGRFVKPGGVLMVSDMVFLSDEPPAAVRDYWAAEYPAVAGTMAQAEALARELGFNVLNSFAYPASEWEDFHRPLETRVAELRPGADEAMAAVLDATAAEIDFCRSHGQHFGYGYFTLRKS